MATLRPQKRRSAMKTPNGTPINVLISSAMPDTCSDSTTISRNAGSAPKIKPSASRNPSNICSLYHHQR